MFRSDGGEVHHHWTNYTEQMDRMVEEAFRLNVKWSLQELARAINGDGKSTPDPVFRVKVVLSDTIQFSPSIDEMAGYVTTVAAEIVNSTSGFQRLPELLARKKTKGAVSLVLPTSVPIFLALLSMSSFFFFPQSICQVIDKDDDVKKTRTSIENGVQRAASNLQEYVKTWDE